MLHHRYFCLCHSGGVIKMQEGKSARKTTSYRIDTETFQLVQKLMPEADCRSFQEFGDKAIAHYIEFLLTKKTNPYLTQFCGRYLYSWKVNCAVQTRSFILLLQKP